MKCPVCGKINTSMLCPQCGFDSSRDYGKYPTFGIPGRTPAVSAKQKQWQEAQKPVKPAVPPAAPPVQATQNSAPKNKWIAFFLCLFLGIFGGHKFYEDKIAMGVLYLCTGGLLGYGWLFDCIVLLFKPNPYFPRRGWKKQ